jgi:hypothetical protein
MAITHTAIYDSVNALDRTHESFLVHLPTRVLRAKPRSRQRHTGP